MIISYLISKTNIHKETQARLLDKDSWIKAGVDIAIGFMAVTVASLVIKQVSTGYPVIVGTASIPMGVYWLDTTDRDYEVGDIVTFPFNPDQIELARYTNQSVYTKQIQGLSGYKIQADVDGSLTSCSPNGDCTAIGQPLQFDSAGRAITPWLKAGQSYTLKNGEAWFYGPHPKSLDSRYAGPIATNIIRGTATPLWTRPIED